MELEFAASVFEWRGPAPFYFVALPGEEASDVAELAARVTYGWGMIPVVATVGGTTWRTSMFAREGTFVLPLKDVVRKGEGIGVDDEIVVRLRIDDRSTG